MAINLETKIYNSYTSISYGKTENIFLKLMHVHLSKRSGRAFLLKNLIKYFPRLNGISLRIHNFHLPLDLRNDAEIGYFFDAGIAHERFYEQILLALIDNKTVFYDIGSNLGYYSLLLSPLTQKVYAFEPNPALADRLGVVVKENVILNVDVFNIGLSNKSSQMTFYYDASRHDLGSFLKRSEHKSSIEVFVTRVDDFIKQHNLLPADILKIDTEGFEIQVLEGFATLQRQRPILLIEWIDELERKESSYEKLNSLIGKGYHIYKVGHNSSLIPWHIKAHCGFSNLLLLPQSISQYPAIEKWLK